MKGPSAGADCAQPVANRFSCVVNLVRETVAGGTSNERTTGFTTVFLLPPSVPVDFFHQLELVL